MSREVLDGNTFANMLRSGAATLGEKREEVNLLNVFPVPDGDTGDNMFMTIDSGAAELMAGSDASIDKVAANAAKGMLLGARGNSGVILSRIFAGIAHGMEGYDKIDISGLSQAFKSGVDEAYRAVSMPVEGTILTVYKDAVRYASERITEDSSFEDFFDDFLKECHSSLERTPELLAVLKESGVVDSGGAGFIYIVEGMRKVLGGETILNNTDAVNLQKKQLNLSLFDENSTLDYGYCTEFLLRLQNSKPDRASFDIDELISFLNSMGDSVVAFMEGTIVKVHVHTKIPGAVIEHCQKYGEFLTFKMENMTLQHHENDIMKNAVKEVRTVSKPKKKFGIVSVAAGDGVKDMFYSLGCDKVVDGGQSMNPSAEDFVKAFDETNADIIYVFPNNSNIILTAKQAGELYTDSDIRVIPTKTIGEGYAAVSMFDGCCEPDDVVNELTEVAQGVVTGIVSIANRGTKKDGIAIKEGDYIGFVNDTIYLDKAERTEAITGLADAIGAGGYDIALLIAGNDVSKDEADSIQSLLAKNYNKTEVILIDGKQPIYDYMLVLM
ncbi:MAG: DAK2 domain-containing protein [Eubacterium sp.]|nr:DAK2 domain-containing protein [Eubacterium sp.]